MEQVGRSSNSPYRERLRDLASLILFLWLIELVDRLIFANSLQNHGIHPRSLAHWEGLIFAPFLHADWGHLLGNSLSLLILGTLILAYGWRELTTVSIAAILAGGALVWLIGQAGTNHIGASSIVFGYLAFLLASGFYRPSLGSILVTLFIIIFYGGSLLGMLPTDSMRESGVSWEGHLGGAIGGFLAARSRRRRFAASSRGR